MEQSFTLSQFNARFPDDATCLEEIKKLRYPKGIHCALCKKTTKHYKINERTAYACKFCRSQTYPLHGTLFEKTTTPLRLWFYCLFLMTHTRGNIAAKQLQRELGVTYKTAWRMRMLLTRDNNDLLTQADGGEEKNSLLKWVFFNKLEFKVAERRQPADN